MKTMLSTFKVNLFLEARNFTATTILPSLLQGFGALGTHQLQGPFVETRGWRRAIHASRASTQHLKSHPNTINSKSSKSHDLNDLNQP